MDTTTTTGPDLRQEREYANLTQAQVAAKMGVDRTAVVRNEGKVRVHAGWARRYREAISELATPEAPSAA